MQVRAEEREGKRNSIIEKKRNEHNGRFVRKGWSWEGYMERSPGMVTGVEKGLGPKTI